MLIYNHFRNRVAQNGYFNDSPLPMVDTNSHLFYYH